MRLTVEGHSDAPVIVGFGYCVDGTYKLFSKGAPMEAALAAMKRAGLFIEQETCVNRTFAENKALFFVPLKRNGAKRRGAASAAQTPRIAGAKIYDKVKDFEAIQLDLSAAVELALEIGIDEETFVKAFAMGFLLASYEFNLFKTKPRPAALKSVAFVGVNEKLQIILDEVQIEARGNFYTRDLASYPADVANSTFIKDWAIEKGKTYGFSVDVLDEPALKKLKMGGILGVNQGSNNPPYLVTCHYRPAQTSDKPRKKLLLVGKGVTFDSGGYSIKPAAGMFGMKYDMHGAASVLGAMTIIARLKLDVEVIGMIGLVENMINGKAIRPGDVVTHYDGTTVEVANTDAEGRLVLADVLSYGVERHKPDVVVDIATLTGACKIAVGHQSIALMTNDDVYSQTMLEAGQETGEVCWELPAFDSYLDQMDSPIADYSNMSSLSGGTAGTIVAAKFLEHFVKETPWIHLDIASTANLPQDFDYRKKGITGVGARLLSEFSRRLA